MDLKPCLICLTPNQIHIRASLKYKDNLTVLQKLQKVAPFQDWLSCYSICQNCKNLLDTSYYFIDMCSKYEENLHMSAQMAKENIVTSVEYDKDRNDSDGESINLNLKTLDNTLNEMNEEHIDEEFFISNDVIAEEEDVETEFTSTDMIDEEQTQIEYITLKIEPKVDIASLKRKDTNSSTDSAEKLLCTHCNTTFSSYLKLGMHIRFEHGHKCIVCAKVFADEDTLGKHIINGHPGYMDKFTCEVCEEKFPIVKELLKHCEREHLMEKNAVRPYSCSICYKRITSLGSFKRHLQYHGGTRSFTCTFCGKNFVTKKDLTEHERIHLNEKKYGCEKCDKRFNTFSNLRSHNYCVHADPSEWKYCCDVCQKRFPWKKSLEEHTRRHYGIKEHQCVICGLLFTSKHDMERHMFLHTNDRPHKCELCKYKSYRDKKGLKVHMVKHHGHTQVN